MARVSRIVGQTCIDEGNVTMTTELTPEPIQKAITDLDAAKLLLDEWKFRQAHC